MKKNNKSKNNNKMVNSWLESFKTPLFTFFVIAIPCLLLWIFFSSDFPFAAAFNIEYSWWIKLLIGIASLVGLTGIVVATKKLKDSDTDSIEKGSSKVKK